MLFFLGQITKKQVVFRNFTIKYMRYATYIFFLPYVVLLSRP